MRLFPGTFLRQVQSIKNLQFTRSVTLIWSRNINLVPIDYGFRPRLRGRLTLRGLTLRRKPWIFGDRVFTLLIVTYVSIRTSDTPVSLAGTPLQAYRTFRYRVQSPKTLHTHRFGTWFEPRYIFGAETLLDRWAVTLSLKDGCF